MPNENKIIVSGVEASRFQGGAGVWVDEGKQTIGMVDQDGIGAYLVIYRDKSKAGIPLAIRSDGIQIPSDDSSYMRFISWDDLYRAVRKIITPEPA